jgi:hypothetical protein
VRCEVRLFVHHITQHHRIRKNPSYSHHNKQNRQRTHGFLLRTAMLSDYIRTASTSSCSLASKTAKSISSISPSKQLQPHTVRFVSMLHCTMFMQAHGFSCSNPFIKTLDQVSARNASRWRNPVAHMHIPCVARSVNSLPAPRGKCIG